MRQQIRRGTWVAASLLGLVLTAPVEAGRWAESLFTEHGHDFGNVPRGSIVRHPFAFTNSLGETITILDIHASCGCTSGTASATTIAPGQSAVIEAQMDTRNFVGEKATTLTVTMMTASGRQSEAKFDIRSNILSDIVLNPGSIDFGAIAKGQTPQQVLTIERLGAPEWRAVRMFGSSRVLTAKLVETSRSAAGVSYQLTVGLKPDAPVGVLRDEIRIVTNDPESPNVPVLVTGLVQGSLTATPTLLPLGNVTGTSVQGRYLVRAENPFTITSIEGNGDGFELVEAQPGSKAAVHVLTMTYTPAAGTTRGDLRHGFRVTTDLPDEPPIDLGATLHVDP